MDYSDNINLPSKEEQIFKDECMYSYDNPNYHEGLYTCMKRFVSFGRQHVEKYSQQTGNTLFLFYQRKHVKRPKDENPRKVSKMAIGIEGGFSGENDGISVEHCYRVVVLPDFKEMTLAECPPRLAEVADAIIERVSAMDEVELGAKAKWDGGNLINTKFAADLLQLPITRLLPPSGWKCDECDKTDNLWLNLTDGSILCGRKFFDGTGGNNHALEHYSVVKYPLAVKLGTITAKGADVYSYGEDDMVIDPLLDRHLKHFGIVAGLMEKTEKTMNELEIHANEKYGEWNLMQETGDLKPAIGPAFTGMHNLGNSCYMNSLMQVLFTIPDFIDEYYLKYSEVVSANNFQGGLYNFRLQMSKLAYGLLSGRYSLPENEEDNKGLTTIVQNGIKPKEFKNLIGHGHAEFSGKGQQDVQEFLLHVIDKIKKNSRGQVDPTDCLRFQVEERIQCKSSGKVRYTTREDYMLSLAVPLGSCTNSDEYLNYKKSHDGDSLFNNKEVTSDQPSIPMRVPLKALFTAFTDSEIIEDFYSSAIQAKTSAMRSVRLKTFPDFLFLHIKKFTFDAQWQPVKLDLAIDVPDEINIADLKGHGLTSDEVELDNCEDNSPLVFDEQQLQQLVGMGFSEWACKRGLMANRNSGGVSNVEQALDWIMNHMDDSDLNAPIASQPKKRKSVAFAETQITEAHIEQVQSMGFTRQQCIRALSETNDNIERAIEWIFNNVEALNSDHSISASSSLSTATSPSTSFRNGDSKYKLTAFICHMGKNTGCGHYVAHIRRPSDDLWYIYNDEKVAFSQKPPKELAYLYLYKRV